MKEFERSANTTRWIGYVEKMRVRKIGEKTDF